MCRFLHANIQLFSLLLLSPIVAQPLQEGHGLEGRSIAPVVDLGYAQYAGVIDIATGNTKFRGLRYAAPPTGMMPPPLLRSFDRLTWPIPGSLRWRAPQPPASMLGIQLANTEPPSCYNVPFSGQLQTNPYRNGTSRVTSGDAPRLDKRSAQLQSSEDCLFLKYSQLLFDHYVGVYGHNSVFTPGVNQTELLPVLVYIHGYVISTSLSAISVILAWH